MKNVIKNMKILSLLIMLGMLFIPGFVSGNSINELQWDGGSPQFGQATCVYNLEIIPSDADKLVLFVEATFIMENGSLKSQSHKFTGATGGYGNYEILTKNEWPPSTAKIGDLKIKKAQSHLLSAVFKLDNINETSFINDIPFMKNDKSIVCPAINHAAFIKKNSSHDMIRIYYDVKPFYNDYKSSRSDFANQKVIGTGRITLNTSKSGVVQPTIKYNSVRLDYSSGKTLRDLNGTVGLRMQNNTLAVTYYSKVEQKITGGARQVVESTTKVLSNSLLDVSSLKASDFFDKEDQYLNPNIYFCPNENGDGAKLSKTSLNAKCFLMTESVHDVNADLYSVSRGDLSFELSSGLKLIYNPGPLTCSSFGRLFNFLKDMYNLILIFAGISLIILGMLDFFGAVASEKPEAMKKAWKNFTTRIIIMFLLALLPALLNMTFSIFKINTCIPGVGGYEYVSNS